MICVSLVGLDLEGCRAAAAAAELAEARLDRLVLTIDEIRDLFSSRPNLIATFRSGAHGDDVRERTLIAAIEAGAAMVDLDMDTDGPIRGSVAGAAARCGCKVILSFHDFEKTPPRPELERRVDRCFEAGADLAKIACLVTRPSDNARLLGLLDSGRAILVAGMGPLGAVTRLAAPLLGSPFTYASLSEDAAAAPGQVPAELLDRLLREIRSWHDPR